MEDVLRKIYIQKHQQLQKNKLDRRLNLDKPQKRPRIYKNIFENYLPLVQSFDLQNQLEIKKEMVFGNNFIQEKHRYKIKSVTSPYEANSLHLPGIKSHRPEISADVHLTKEDLIMQLKNPQRFKARQRQVQKATKLKYAKKRFHIQISRIIFIIRLSNMRKKSLLQNRQRTQATSKNLLLVIDKLVNKYYVKVLQEQLLKYLELIKIKIQQPKMMMEKQILNMMYYLSKKLAQSAISSEMMEFLMAIGRKNSFFPNDYLTEYEAARLQFGPKCGCLQNVTQSQKKMIIAICVGMKVFCAHVLYRPWILQIQRSPISPQQIINNYSPIVKMIHGTASILYYILMEEFCDKIQTKPFDLNFKVLQKHKYMIQGFSNIFPKEYDVQIVYNPNQIFPNQKKKIFNALRNENPETFETIRQNIILWIQRLYKAFKIEQKKLELYRRQVIKQKQKEIIRQIVQNNKKDSHLTQQPTDKKQHINRQMDITKRIFDRQIKKSHKV